MSTNENRDQQLPTALVWLLAYQWLLVALAVVLACNLVTMGLGLKLQLMGRLLGFLEVLVLAGWAMAMGYASVGMVRRTPFAFLVGMICHLLLAILGLTGVIGFTVIWFYASWSGSGAWV